MGTDHNSKGVFRINNAPNVFQGGSIKPLGLKFKFHSNVIEGDLSQKGLKDLTRGFFFVRQKRIPTIIAQAVGIGTTKHGQLPVIGVSSNYSNSYSSNYLSESFLTGNLKPKLGSSFTMLRYNDNSDQSEVLKNALLCPEADLRTDLYNTYFNSSEYLVKKSKFQTNYRYFKKTSGNDSHYYLETPTTTLPKLLFKEFNASLLLVEPGIELIKNQTETFSSKAGDSATAYKHVDVRYGDYADPFNLISNMTAYNGSKTKVRGIFNTYVGSNISDIESGTYYNIYQKGFDFDKYWTDYFKIRYNDTSSYHAISDRFEYSDVENRMSKSCYRGDCYINTYTHRMNWNFIDPDLPTNTTIVDPYTWYKNFRVVNKLTKTVKLDGKGLNELTNELSYNKLLNNFTYKNYTIKNKNYSDDESVGEPKVGEPIDDEDKGFKKYSEINGVFGTNKLNRPDINAVGLGH